VQVLLLLVLQDVVLLDIILQVQHVLNVLKDLLSVHQLINLLLVWLVITLHLVQNVLNYLLDNQQLH
jgi:hypothetical protein